MNLPPVKQEYFALGGGLDLLTPAIALKSGMVIDANNYEPEISGGYKRRNGFERYDGRPGPTWSSTYFTLNANITGVIAVGDTISGPVGGNTAKVLAISGSTLVLGVVTGSFQTGDPLRVSGTIQATATGELWEKGSPNPSDHADNMLLAANNIRSTIQKPPGSGAIRGVWVFRDVVYAFRDNAAGTAGDMYKATYTGWEKITFGSEIGFAMLSPYSAVTITIAAPGVVSFPSHTFSDGQTIVFTTTGALPVGIVAGTVYFVINKAAGTFQLSATVGGTAITTTATTTASTTVANTAIVSASATVGDGSSIVAAGTAGGTTTTVSSTQYGIHTCAAVTTVTITIATPGVVSYAGHTFSDGQPVAFYTSGALPTGISPYTIYYVINKAVDTFQIAATAGGAAIATSGTQSGTQTCVLGVSAAIKAGEYIGNAATAPTKTALVAAVLTRTGTWGKDAVGTLVVIPLTGTFATSETLYVGAAQKAASTTAATAITRLPGGKLEFVNANFTSANDTTKVYGADGVNPAFEFDGTNYIPIHTGMTTDTPTHVTFHRFYLFLSFKGSAQFSAITNPYAWSAILGAGELACGDDITGFLPQSGTSAGSSMAIFTKSRTSILYGSSSSTWNMVTSVNNIGYAAYTVQPVSNNTYGLTARGIQSLITTLNYGDFDYASVSHQVTPFIVARRGTETASTSLRTKDQYRLYYADGYCLVLGLTGDAVSGVMPINYGKAVRCIATATLTTGEEVTYFGSDDGYVYRDNIGTSLDGSAIEAWVRMSFNHSKSPQIRKRYRRAVLEINADGYAKVNMSYDLGYASPNITAPIYGADQVMTGRGSHWDQFIWESFTWDAAVIEQPKISLEGVEKNISFLFHSNRAQDESHTLQGLTLFYSLLRAER